MTPEENIFDIGDAVISSCNTGYEFNHDGISYSGFSFVCQGNSSWNVSLEKSPPFKEVQANPHCRSKPGLLVIDKQNILKFNPQRGTLSVADVPRNSNLTSICTIRNN